MRQFLILAALGLAACGQPAVTTPPVSMTFTSQAAQSGIDTFDLVTIRTTTGSFTNTRQVVGAQCEVFGTEYSAKFQSPAVLRMPLYRGRTSDARVVCRGNVNGATREGATTLEATNLTAPDNEGITLSVGTGGTKIGAVFSIRDRARDRFSYPNNLRVQLR
ncbi:MAG: hypothetical protein ACPG5U_10790 [Planktomarina sp.]